MTDGQTYCLVVGGLILFWMIFGWGFRAALRWWDERHFRPYMIRCPRCGQRWEFTSVDVFAEIDAHQEECWINQNQTGK